MLLCCLGQKQAGWGRRRQQSTLRRIFGQTVFRSRRSTRDKWTVRRPKLWRERDGIFFFYDGSSAAVPIEREAQTAPKNWNLVFVGGKKILCWLKASKQLICINKINSRPHFLGCTEIIAYTWREHACTACTMHARWNQSNTSIT